MTAYSIYACGESAMTFDLGPLIRPDTNDRIGSMAAWLRNAPPAGLKDVITAYSSLTLVFDLSSLPDQHDQPNGVYQFMKHCLEEAFAKSGHGPSTSPPVKSIPVCYDPLLGSDLLRLANDKAMDPEEIVALHLSETYRVYMIGFLPGFPYLARLPATLYTERKRQPVHVPKGAVAIAGEQTGIYPFASPGGWHVIGQTPLSLFNASVEPPVLLCAGDHVRFEPISLHTFNAMNDTQ